MAFNVLLACEETLQPLTFDANGNLLPTANNTLYQVIDAFLSFELGALQAAKGELTVGYDPTDTISIVLAEGTYGVSQLTQLSLANATSVISFAPNIAYFIQGVVAPNAVTAADANALKAILTARNVPIISSGNIDPYGQLTPYLLTTRQATQTPS